MGAGQADSPAADSRQTGVDDSEGQMTAYRSQQVAHNKSRGEGPGMPITLQDYNLRSTSWPSGGCRLKIVGPTSIDLSSRRFRPSRVRGRSPVCQFDIANVLLLHGRRRGNPQLSQLEGWERFRADSGGHAGARKSPQIHLRFVRY